MKGVRHTLLDGVWLYLVFNSAARRKVTGGARGRRDLLHGLPSASQPLITEPLR